MLAIPSKRQDQPLVCFLKRAEVDVLLAAPNLSSWHGRRDQALLWVAFQTGLRVSEITGLRHQDLELGPGANFRASLDKNIPKLRRIFVRIQGVAKGA